jgi:hypothetical protein
VDIPDNAVERLALEKLDELIEQIERYRSVTRQNDSTDALLSVLLSVRATVSFKEIKALCKVTAEFSEKQLAMIRAQRSDDSFFDSIKILGEEN